MNKIIISSILILFLLSGVADAANIIIEDADQTWNLTLNDINFNLNLNPRIKLEYVDSLDSIWDSKLIPFQSENRRPVANAGGPYYSKINEPIPFYGSGTDPDGDDIIAYAWDFDNDEITDSTLQNPTQSWSVAGTYHPMLKVQDERGAWSEWDWSEVNVYDPNPHLGPYPLSVFDKYYIRIFNIDDIGKAYVNGELVSSATFGQDSGLIDITDDLHLGDNEIHLTVKNLKEGYTYGFDIIHDDGTLEICKWIWHDSCGDVGVYGCNDNEQTGEKIVYDEGITLELEEREFSDFSFVQLTDVHIGYDQKSTGALKTIDMRQRLRNFAIALEEINRLNHKPDFILHTGDLVEWNNPNFFMAFKGILESCDIPSYFIPGNHDRRTLLFGDDALAKYHEYINPINPIGRDKYNFTFREEYLFIGLDSGKDYNEYHTCSSCVLPVFIDYSPESDGLSAEQIKFLYTQDNRPKIIFLHHPVIEENDKNDVLPEGCYPHVLPEGCYPQSVPPNGPGGNDACIANYRREFIEYCMDQKNNVQLVLTGHTHRQKILKIHGDTVESDGKNEERPLFIQTLSATKDAPEGNGFGYIKVDKNKANYEKKVLSMQPKRVIKTELRVIPEGWLHVPKLRWCTPHAYDSQGRHTGVNEAGLVERNIPQSYHTGIYNGEIGSKDTPHMIVLFVDDVYQCKWKPFPATIQEQQFSKQQNVQEMAEEEEEFFNVISVRTYDNDSFTDSFYYNFSITENGTATVTLNQTNINYLMEIDYDGDGDVDEYKSPDSTETNYAPTATVFSPENDSIFVHGDEITFSGTGTDPEDGTLTNTSLVWSSDINGLTGFGNEFSTTNLSAGSHTITLKVNDSAYLIDTDSVEIQINAPDLTLNSSNILFSNSNPAAGENITINATIRNIGLIDATNVRVEFYDGIPEFQISNVTISTIRASETETVNVR